MDLGWVLILSNQLLSKIFLRLSSKFKQRQFLDNIGDNILQTCKKQKAFSVCIYIYIYTYIIYIYIYMK